MNRDFNREMEGIIAGLGDKRPRLLLHVCCAPCASSVLERLYPHFDVTMYYYDPNIHPAAEYEKRGAELAKLLRAGGYQGVEIIWGEYKPAEFFSAAAGLESEPEGGARCEKCFELRLEAAARLAKERDFDFFCTTLTVSPHKNSLLINEIGQKLAQAHNIPWLPSDFKKKDGYLRSIRLCQQYGIYRQCFCGCVFSGGSLD